MIELDLLKLSLKIGDIDEKSHLLYMSLSWYHCISIHIICNRTYRVRKKRILCEKIGYLLIPASLPTLQ